MEAKNKQCNLAELNNKQTRKRGYFTSSLHKVQSVFLGLFLALILILLHSSCKYLLVKSFGMKKPKEMTDSEVIDYMKEKRIDYDYLLRIRNRQDMGNVSKELDGLNVVVMLDRKFNILSIADSQVCHMGVRSTAKQILRDSTLLEKVEIRKNVKELFEKNLAILDGKNGVTDFEKGKKFLMVFGCSRWTGMNEKMTDVDFIEDLQKNGSREKVSVLVINFDPVEGMLKKKRKN